MAALTVALAMFAPLAWVLLRGLEADTALWHRLIATRVPALMGNTMALAVAVTGLTIITGATLALLVERTDLPGRSWWSWLLALPLVLPPYVGALTWISVFGPRGWLAHWPVDVFSFGVISIVLTSFTYPYVYLLTRAALKRLGAQYQEAAQSCGLSPLHTVFRALLPMLRPAIGAGALLAALYVLSDFGAVAMLRYDTFASSIYFQMSGRLDRSGAAVLSTVLVVITLALLVLESRIQGQNSQNKASRRPTPLPLGRAKGPALALVVLVFAVTALMPLAVLSAWSWQGIGTGALNQRFWGYAVNSMTVAVSAAVLSMLFSVPLVWLRYRHPSPVSATLMRLASAGYALPGAIVALGSIFFFSRWLPWLYGTEAVVVAAMLLRFLPQSLQGTAAGIGQVPLNLDEAARGVGLGTGAILARVVVPLAWPGILAGGALVFVSSLKELPATMLLRPAGFDTLAVRIWMEAHEGFYHLAAPPALVLVLVSLPLLRWLLNR